MIHGLPSQPKILTLKNVKGTELCKMVAPKNRMNNLARTHRAKNKQFIFAFCGMGRAAIKIKIFKDTITLVSKFELEGPEIRAKKSSYTPEEP